MMKALNIKTNLKTALIEDKKNPFIKYNIRLLLLFKIFEFLPFESTLDEIEKYFIGCSFKFPVKVDVEESIVNALRITDHGSAV
jgi:hypothetical protein